MIDQNDVKDWYFDSKEGMFHIPCIFCGEMARLDLDFPKHLGLVQCDNCGGIWRFSTETKTVTKIYRDPNLMKNNEGYSDPTAGKAINNADNDIEDERFHKLLRTLFYICDIAGFKIDGRVVLEDKITGKIYR